MQSIESLETMVQKMIAYIKSENFKGFDPYDALNSPLPFHWLGKYGQSVAIQVLKRCPVNVRPLLGIKKGHNPKGMGLLLEAFSRLTSFYRSPEYRQVAEYLYSWLLEHSTPGFSGRGWGYNFVWANPGKVLKAYHPSIVVSAFVGKGIYEYQKATGSAEAIQALRSICDYILQDLPRSENENEICFSYTDARKDCCYNASLLGAEILAKAYSLTGEERLKRQALAAADFVVSRQHADGRWNYSVSLDGKKERRQVDFHQGFILTSLWELMRACEVRTDRYMNALRKGLAFYRREQFLPDGRSRWRYPKSFPADIHHQAQGIITFATLRDLEDTSLEFARRIAEWSAANMWDGRGYFYYRRYLFFVNRIPYMRWGQAWMLLALASLLAAGKEKPRLPHS